MCVHETAHTKPHELCATPTTIIDISSIVIVVIVTCCCLLLFARFAHAHRHGRHGLKNVQKHVHTYMCTRTHECYAYVQMLMVYAVTNCYVLFWQVNNSHEFHANTHENARAICWVLLFVLCVAASFVPWNACVFFVFWHVQKIPNTDHLSLSLSLPIRRLVGRLLALFSPFGARTQRRPDKKKKQHAFRTSSIRTHAGLLF